MSRMRAALRLWLAVLVLAPMSLAGAPAPPSPARLAMDPPTQAELDAAIKANNPVLKQLETKENEIAQLQQPSTLASLFVVETILQQYNKAQDAVIKAKKINFIFTPDAFVKAMLPSCLQARASANGLDKCRKCDMS